MQFAGLIDFSGIGINCNIIKAFRTENSRIDMAAAIAP